MSNFFSRTFRRRFVGLPLIVGTVGLISASSALGAQTAESGAAIERGDLKPLAPGVFEGETVAGDLAFEPTDVATPGNREGLPEAAAERGEVGMIVQEEVVKRWQVRPIVEGGITYDDNIYISPDHKEGDILFSLGAGFAYEYGDYRAKEESYFGVNYVGTGLVFAENSQNNALNHGAGIVAQYTANKLTLRLRSNYLYLSGSDRDVGNWTNRQLIDNSILATYDYSDKTTLDFELVQSATLYDSYNDSYQYFLKAGADYRITPKIVLGMEGRFGIQEAQENTSQTYEQLRLRANYQVTGKMLARATVGAEVRQYNGGRGDTVSPVFSLAADWQARENTSVSLEGYRNITSAASYRNQNQVVTGVAFGVTQKLFQWVTVGLDTGYENARYEATRSSVRADREDNYFFIRPSVSAPVHRWVDAGVFYEYRRNDSNQPSDRFSNNRVGIELSSRF